MTQLFLSLVVLAFALTPAAAQGALPRLVPQTGHSQPVRSVALGEGGRLAATASSDGSIKLWRAETGELIRSLSLPSEAGGVAFRSGHPHLVGMGEDSVYVWDVRTGATLRALSAPDARALALSPDGRFAAVSTDPYDRPSEVLVWEIDTGRLVHRIPAHENYVNDVAFHPGRPLVATASGDSTVTLWSLDSGTPVRTLTGPAGSTVRLAFDADGQHVAASSADRSAWVWEVASGDVVAELPGVYAPQLGQSLYYPIGFSRDGERLVTGDTDLGVLDVWNLEARERTSRVRVLQHPGSFGIHDFDVSGGGQFLAVAGSGEAHVFGLVDGLHRPLAGPVGWVERVEACTRGGSEALVVNLSNERTAAWWDLETGQPTRRVDHEQSYALFSYAPDCRSVAVVNGNGLVLRSVAEGADLATFPGYDPESFVLLISDLDVSPDGQTIAAAGGPTPSATEVTVRNAETGAVRLAWQAEEEPYEVTWLRFSPDGRRLATLGSEPQLARVSALRLWDAKTGELARSFESPWRLWAEGPASEHHPAAFSPDGRLIAADAAWEAHGSVLGVESGVALWNAETGERVLSVEGGAPVAFSPDGRVFATGGPGHTVVLWDATTGERVASLEGHTNLVTTLAFVAGGRFLATGGWDQTVRFWEVDTGRERARLTSFGEDWLVVTPDGRFDAPDLERVSGAVWVAPDDPLTPLPIEAFMREFYEPRLLPRVLAGEPFPDVGSILDKNRVQPAVDIATAELAPDGTATVTVAVEGRARTYGGEERQSGVHDLRLFRDGRLVAWADGELVSGTGSETVTFDGVPLPAGADSVAFSAYAFNRDLVKSRTAYADLSVPAAPPRGRRAYVVSLGVDAFADARWDLSFAAADARAYASTLDSTLAASGDYDAVVAVALVSDADAAHGTAAALRGALLRLAGEPLDADAEAALAGVPGAERLVEATPDDVVILTASTHGYASPDGAFYLFPSDVPAENGGLADPALLEAAVSSDELSAWLRGVDAGALAVVVDACNAAGAVEGNGFKPGPMGARGLGQLAFDKGAAVLTATQSDQPALEASATERGLLTFALVENGLLAGQADGAGAGGAADGRVTLSEWLAYGAERVPALYAEVRAGAVETFGRGGVRARSLPPDLAVGAGGSGAAAAGVQTPALFDFRRGELDVVLSSSSPR